MKIWKALGLFLFILAAHYVQADNNVNQTLKSKTRLLVFTKNGDGFVHDNIQQSVEAFKLLGKKLNLEVDVSDNASIFTEENLKLYHIITFSNTNNDIFENNEQRLAFRRWIEAGGGIMGIHSALGTERNWKWFTQLLGGSFTWHPKKQILHLTKISNHRSIENTPTNWVWEDECYFSKNYYPGIITLLIADLNKLADEDQKNVENHKTSFGSLHPVTWYQYFDGGTSWITTLGHNPEAYRSQVFLKHLEDGLKFLIKKTKKLDYSQAYATSFDEDLIYK